MACPLIVTNLVAHTTPCLGCGRGGFEFLEDVHGTHESLEDIVHLLVFWEHPRETAHPRHVGFHRGGCRLSLQRGENRAELIDDTLFSARDAK